eukprot:gb/GFBE01082237.1/.p1 GENE.gb/GFBE01082237.1/~~gb/GFBE01082237.1/.p1  ORF type:complete len:380 (+),score=101.08 gb/GFBE01082237.1/:1-1140(+)
MAFVLKTSFQGDVRRKRFDSVDDVTFETISKTITDSFGMTDYIARYQDDEGDWCTLTSTTLRDALELSNAGKLLRLDIAPASPQGCEEEISDAGSWEAVDLVEEANEGGDADMEMLGSSSLAVDSYESEEVVHKGGDVDMETVVSEDLEMEQTAAEGSGSTDDMAAAQAFAPASPWAQSFSTAQTDREEHFRMESSFAEPDTLLAEVQPSTPEDQPDAGSSIPDDSGGSAEQLLSEAEKIQIVLAAFDANGDGKLNFDESNDLQKFAAGDCIPFEVYQALCSELRATESTGLGVEALEILYERYGTLERDFEAAIRKLGSTQAPQTLPNEQAWGDGRPAGSSLPVHPLVGLGLLAVCPAGAGALALGSLGMALARRARS